MRIFVYEHLSSGALAGQPGVESLRREGFAMLAAVLADLSRCPGVRPVALVETDLVGSLHAEWPGVEIHAAGGEERFAEASLNEDPFRRLAHAADFTLVIAPEFDDLLEQRCRWALEEGSTLLGPSPTAVRLTGDKQALADHLRRLGVPTPLTAPCLGDDPPWPYPVVCKPRFGAGSQHTLRVGDRDDYAAFQKRIAGETGSLREGVVQPFVQGRPVSVAFLAGPRGRIALPAAEQCLSNDGGFRYLGGRVPLGLESTLFSRDAKRSATAPALRFASRLNRVDYMLQARAQSLAERAAHAVEGLTGYFGVDLVLGESADGSDDVVIEINPRLTTSYVGLRRLARGNLMQALLDLARGVQPEPLQWHDQPVRFYPDGRLD